MKERYLWACIDCGSVECECEELECNANNAPFTVTEKQLTEKDIENIVDELNTKISDLTNWKRWCKIIIKK